jgi:hypothetical protein
MKEFRGAAALGVACASLLAWPVAGATAQTSAERAVVTRSEQAARDDERVRILQEELTREQGMAADATLRRAERLAVRDPRGVQEAEQAQRRAADNMAALRREIEGAAKPAGAATSGTPAEGLAIPAARRAAPSPSAKDPTDAPWWDVYARAPRQTQSLMAQRAASVLVRPIAVTTAAPLPH